MEGKAESGGRSERGRGKWREKKKLEGEVSDQREGNKGRKSEGSKIEIIGVVKGKKVKG